MSHRVFLWHVTRPLFFCLTGLAFPLGVLLSVFGRTPKHLSVLCPRVRSTFTAHRILHHPEHSSRTLTPPNPQISSLHSPQLVPRPRSIHHLFIISSGTSSLLREWLFFKKGSAETRDRWTLGGSVELQTPVPTIRVEDIPREPLWSRGWQTRW